MKISKLTSAYIAGFVDGEGYLGITRNRAHSGSIYYRAVMKVAGTDEKQIRWFHESFSGWFETRDFPNTNNKRAYMWTITGKGLKPFLMKIYPYLKIKRPQAEIIFEKERLKSLRVNKGGKEGWVYPKGVKEKIEELYFQIRKLNKRGKN